MVHALIFILMNKVLKKLITLALALKNNLEYEEEVVEISADASRLNLVDKNWQNF